MRSPRRKLANQADGRLKQSQDRPVKSGLRQLAVYRPKVTLPNGRHVGDTHSGGQ